MKAGDDEREKGYRATRLVSCSSLISKLEEVLNKYGQPKGKKKRKKKKKK